MRARRITAVLALAGVWLVPGMARAVPPGSPVTFTAPYGIDFSTVSSVGGGTSTASADRSTGAIQVHLAPNCASGVCTGATATNAFGVAEVADFYKRKPKPGDVTAVATFFVDSAATSGTTALPEVGVRISGGGVSRTCRVPVNVPADDQTITVQCTLSTDGQFIRVTGLTQGSVSDSLGDGAPVTLDIVATVQEITVSTT